MVIHGCLLYNHVNALQGYLKSHLENVLDKEIYMLPSFDVVVANPPYIRQELREVEQKEKIKEMIETEYKELSIGKAPKAFIVLDKIKEH
jgi:methylase of polypeptide subunit release factors